MKVPELIQCNVYNFYTFEKWEKNNDKYDLAIILNSFLNKHYRSLRFPPPPPVRIVCIAHLFILKPTNHQL